MVFCCGGMPFFLELMELVAQPGLLPLVVAEVKSLQSYHHSLVMGIWVLILGMVFDFHTGVVTEMRYAGLVRWSEPKQY